jgi:hypothetical protein
MTIRLLIALYSATLWTAVAQTSVAITNTIFVDDQINCGPGQSCSEGNVSGWICGPQTGIAVFTKTQYPSAGAAGLYAAYLGDTSGSGSIFQTMGITVQPNTTYTLKVEVGARADYPFTGYEAALLAGGTVLAKGSSATPVGGKFVIETIVYSSGAAPPQAGQPLQIFIKSTGFGQVNVDAVTLTYQ